MTQHKKEHIDEFIHTSNENNESLNENININQELEEKQYKNHKFNLLNQFTHPGMILFGLIAYYYIL